MGRKGGGEPDGPQLGGTALSDGELGGSALPDGPQLGGTGTGRGEPDGPQLGGSGTGRGEPDGPQLGGTGSADGAQPGGTASADASPGAGRAGGPARPRTPSQRLVEEGSSEAIVTWVGRSERVLPSAARWIGFWASVYARFARHRGSVLAGGLAFFGLLSLVPSFLSLGALVTLLYDPAEFAEDVEILLTGRQEALSSLGSILGSIHTLDGSTSTSPGVAGLISLAVALYAASRFVYVGRQVLDVAFELDPQPPSLLSRGIAIAITLVVQVAIVVGVIALTLVPRLLELFGLDQANGRLLGVIRLPLMLALVYFALTVAMRFGTRARRVVGWLNHGALLGTTIIVLGTLGLSWFLSVSLTYSQIVAILGGVIALELWLYVVGVAIVVSAEIEGIRHGFRRRDREVA
jgi:membrane protein